MAQGPELVDAHFNIDELDKEYLASTIKDWSLSHGLVMRPTTLSPPEIYSHIAATAPVTLFPSRFPRICFERARSVQKDFNRLYAYISQDDEFLHTVLAEILDVDDFIFQLWKVHLKVKDEGYTQNLSLGLFRSDYMVHQPSDESQPTIKQVEFNTIAASFGGLSSLASKLHRFLATESYQNIRHFNVLDDFALPENQCCDQLAQGIQIAHNQYIKRTVSPKYDFCVIFLVYSLEQNIFDQRHLEFSLKSLQPEISTFYLPFSEVFQHTTLEESSDRKLLYHLPSNPSRIFEVTVVYFRAGYSPSDYPAQSAWDARLHIEKSKAIKCPSILTQLAGAKKVQQVLANPDSIAKKNVLNLLQGTNESYRLDETFTSIHPLDDSPAGLEAQKIATDIEVSKDYVLKPQREGGGNNIYCSAIPKFLASLPKIKWKSYILMKIINSPPVYNHCLKNGIISSGCVISELGIFGSCLWDHQTKEIFYNEEAGYLLRTKSVKSEEGGIATGFSSIDSCHLV